MRRFQRENENLVACMRTHLINVDSFGVFDDDYDVFFRKRCHEISRELKKRVIKQDVDSKESATPAKDTAEVDTE